MKLAVTPIIVFIFFSSPTFACYKAELSDEENFNTCNELAQQDADIAQIVAEDLADGIGLKISKAGGLTRSRRHRDICCAAGLTISVQDTVGSTIAFAGIAHLGATVAEQNLRCILDCRDMVTLETASFDAPVLDGGVLVPQAPGLGITVNRDVLGTPVAIWET